MHSVYLKIHGPIFPPLSWIKLRRRDSRVTRLPRGETPPLWYWRWDFPRQNCLPDLLLWICKAGKHSWRHGQLRVWSCAFLLLLPFYTAQESLKEELQLLFPKRQGVGIAHTHQTEEGMTWGEVGWNCPWTWLGVRQESDIPVLHFALLQPFFGTRATREIKWRLYLPRGATRMNEHNSQCLSKKTVQSLK